MEGGHRVLRQSIRYSSFPSRFSPLRPAVLLVIKVRHGIFASSERSVKPLGCPQRLSALLGSARRRAPAARSASESPGFRVSLLPSRTRRRWADSDCDPWAGRVRVGRSLNRVTTPGRYWAWCARSPGCQSCHAGAQCARKRLPRASLLRKRDHAPSQLPSAVWPLSRVASPMPGFVLTRVTAGLNPLYSEPYSEPSDNLFPAPPLCCTPPSCGRWPLIVVYLSPLLHFP